eukprot:TRINITY_DN18310_c0_g2_i1.p1 TRINITY_DN18310_c0_g2~~TRINITY_DN18310_c0_g2_i1.p1  ORF type:complete len:107 (+),score=37.67 TRINITY_DN18310_c0_g2_i1:2-322(+)
MHYLFGFDTICKYFYLFPSLRGFSSGKEMLNEEKLFSFPVVPIDVEYLKLSTSWNITVSKMTNLTTLKIEYCDQNKDVGEMLTSLKKLKYLEINKKPQISDLPPSL